MPVWEKHVVCSSSANKVLLKPSCGTHSINRQSSGISGVDSRRLGNIRRCPASSWFSHVLGGWKQKRHENPQQIMIHLSNKKVKCLVKTWSWCLRRCVCVCEIVSFSKYPIYFPLRFYAKTGEEYQMGGSHTIFLWDLYALAAAVTSNSTRKKECLIIFVLDLKINDTKLHLVTSLHIKGYGRHPTKTWHLPLRPKFKEIHGTWVH